MNLRVEGEPKAMDTYADFVFAFESHTASEKLPLYLNFSNFETKLSASSSAEHTSEIVGQMLQLQKAENVLGSFCCYEICFPAEY